MGGRNECMADMGENLGEVILFDYLLLQIIGTYYLSNCSTAQPTLFQVWTADTSQLYLGSLIKKHQVWKTTRVICFGWVLPDLPTWMGGGNCLRQGNGAKKLCLQTILRQLRLICKQKESTHTYTCL